MSDTTTEETGKQKTPRLAQVIKVYDPDNPPPDHLDCFGKGFLASDPACTGDPNQPADTPCYCMKECQARTKTVQQVIQKTLRQPPMSSEDNAVKRTGKMTIEGVIDQFSLLLREHPNFSKVLLIKKTNQTAEIIKAGGDETVIGEITLYRKRGSGNHISVGWLFEWEGYTQKKKRKGNMFYWNGDYSSRTFPLLEEVVFQLPKILDTYKD